MNQFFSHSGVLFVTGYRTFLRESLGPPRVQRLMRGDLGYYSEEVLPSALLPPHLLVRAGFRLPQGLVPLSFWVQVKNWTSLLTAPVPRGTAQMTRGKGQNCLAYAVQFQSSQWYFLPHEKVNLPQRTTVGSCDLAYVH